jgi:hypothetical protein
MERVRSNFKYIYSSGEGLGKNKSGITECIQIKKRDENLGVK